MRSNAVTANGTTKRSLSAFRMPKGWKTTWRTVICFWDECKEDPRVGQPRASNSQRALEYRKRPKPLVGVRVKVVRLLSNVRFCARCCRAVESYSGPRLDDWRAFPETAFTFCVTSGGRNLTGFVCSNEASLGVYPPSGNESSIIGANYLSVCPRSIPYHRVYSYALQADTSSSSAARALFRASSSLTAS